MDQILPIDALGLVSDSRVFEDNHGLVRLVDCMPRFFDDDILRGDAAIVQMARVSYGAGTKKSRNDRALIRYLIRHWHMSPFEGAELKFHIRCPIVLKNQIFRHRTACVAGKSRVFISRWPGKVLKIGEITTISIAHLADICANSNKLADFNDSYRILSCYITEDGSPSFTQTTLRNAWCNGSRRVLEIRTEFGEKITATPDHMFYSDSGWKPLIHIVVSMGKILHKVGKTLKFAAIKSVEFRGLQEVYDLEIGDPCHNFICEGMLIHNCVNEVSGRYSQIEDAQYWPKSIKKQGIAGNKQQSCHENAGEKAQKLYGLLRQNAANSYKIYRELLDAGGSREMARFGLPQTQYTEFYFKMNLRNLLNFFRQRCSVNPETHEGGHAQYGTRVIADEMYKIAEILFPATIEAFRDYQMDSLTLSRQDIRLLQADSRDPLPRRLSILKEKYPQFADLSLGEFREWKEKKKRLREL